MTDKIKKVHPEVKSGLHPRNKHRRRYDFKQLIGTCPELEQFVKLNQYDDESIDFFNPEAVKMLNKALLKHYYNIDHWNVPVNYLSPPIPGRADYIHHVADLLCSSLPDNIGKGIPRGSRIKCLDIGVGASCVYPIIGSKEYGWSFIGTDIDPASINSASKIVDCNPFLKRKVELRLQNDPNNIFFGILQKRERIDVSICNPPFHASLAEAQAATVRKLSNLRRQKVDKPILNFGGRYNELCCEGGEARFVDVMIEQSMQYAISCLWFTTLISKKSNLKKAYKTLKKAEATDVKTIPMGQGNKTSRIVAWTYLSPDQQQKWINTRWKLRSG